MPAWELGEPQPWTPMTSPEAIRGLRERVRRTQWPDIEDVPGWSEGSDPRYLRDLAHHWSERFDWAAREADVAKHPWFDVAALRTGIPSGHEVSARIRFIHAKAAVSTGRPALPLLLCHGWPDSSWRYLEVIDRLTNPGAESDTPTGGFDVIVPEMPGFGYSTLAGPALNSIEVAELWAALMQRLGYTRYLVAGGDIGSAVSRYLALNHPGEVIAVHRMDAGLPVYSGDPGALSDNERKWMRDAAAWSAREGAYAAMHRTKPVTIGAALSDSPVGLAAWVVEKLHAWSDGSHSSIPPFSMNAILDLVTTTWMRNSVTPGIRMYRANAAIPPEEHARRVEVPSGFSLFPADILPPPPEWLHRVADVTYVSHPTHGGHFAPRETPDSYVHELRAFFRPWG
ncbi:epoxide hydrolase family protein [Microbacterium sp. AZCO]|uniref:epoxide hydrolase family protein n=1 Tax=Microbacterium sp. AZCO TaxID=3142976 RepID=UPI0031F39855